MAYSDVVEALSGIQSHWRVQEAAGAGTIEDSVGAVDSTSHGATLGEQALLAEGGTSGFFNAAEADAIVFGDVYDFADSAGTSTYGDPSADGTNSWTKSTGSAGWSLLDDAVRQPTGPTTGSDRVTSQTDEQVQDVVFANTLTYTAGATYKIWIHGSGGAKRAVDTQVSVNDGSSYNTRATDTIATAAAAAWVSIDITSLITSQTTLDQLRLRMICNSTAGGGGQSDVAVNAVYVEKLVPGSRSPFSFVLWFHPTVVDATVRYPLAKVAGSNLGGYDFAIWNAGVRFRRFDVSAGSDAATWSHGGAFVANATYMLVVTYDGTTLKLYVDTVERGSVGSTRAVPNTSASLTVGRHSGGGSGTTSYISHVAVFDRALTTTEIGDLYTAGTTTGGTPVSASDTGSGADSAVLVTSYAQSEQVTVDAVAALIAVAAVSDQQTSVTDTGGVTVPVAGSDVNQTPVETGALSAALSGSDVNGATEASALLAALAAADANATPTESGSIIFPGVTDTGSGSDASAFIAALTGSDVNGTPVDVATLASAITAADSNSISTEATTLVAVLSDADTGGAVEAIALAVALAVADVNATAVDNAQFAAEDTFSVSDTGEGVDASAVVAEVADADTGSGQDAAAPLFQATGAEAGLGADASALAASVPGSDTAQGSDSAEPVVGVAAADTSSGSDLAALVALVIGSDSLLSQETAAALTALSASELASVVTEAVALVALLTSADTNSTVLETGDVPTAQDKVAGDTNTITTETSALTVSVVAQQVALSSEDASVGVTLTVNETPASVQDLASLLAVIATIEAGTGIDVASVQFPGGYVVPVATIERVVQEATITRATLGTVEGTRPRATIVRKEEV